MANIASQVKRNERTERERLENRRLERAVDGGDAAAVEVEHRELVSRIDKAVQRGALHPNNGARKKSRAARLRSRSAA